tara:strand:+ start:33 stop:725 length:693 start_codon:yes stop_codon:yes gene_type:complete
MPQKIDKKYNVVFYIIILFIVSSINNNYLIENQNSYFKIKNIQVEGLEVSQNLKIKKKLNFLVGKNIFNLDVEKLETKLNSFKYIENYKVSKLFPSILKVELKKTNFLAKTYNDGKKYYIGSNKKLIIYTNQIENNDLPTVYGKFTNEDFFKLREIIIDQKFDIKKISHYYYYPSKRWDIKLINGTLVKLPMQNLNDAITKLEKIINEKINDLNKTIDLRVPNQIIFNNG